MGGWVDVFRRMLSWWSSPNSAPPEDGLEATVPITKLHAKIPNRRLHAAVRGNQ